MGLVATDSVAGATVVTADMVVRIWWIWWLRRVWYGYSPWLYGPMVYDWGYSNYYNPYYDNGLGVVGQPSVYDYSQPINTQSAPPQPSVTDQAGTEFDSARDAFKAGDYAKALDLTDQAIRQLPNDAALHELRGVTLIAMHRYTEAAAPLYAVLTVGPGWDWPTLISLYPDVSVYTDQLRALESYCRDNNRSAPGQFVLAYLYLTQGNTDAALHQLKRVVALQPKDAVATQLIKRLDPSYSPPAAPGSGDPLSLPRRVGAGWLDTHFRDSQGRTVRGRLDGRAGTGNQDYLDLHRAGTLHMEGRAERP